MQKPVLLLAGLGVGVCASVIPYVCDQLAMSRLPRSSFALLPTPAGDCNHDRSDRFETDPSA